MLSKKKKMPKRQNKFVLCYLCGCEIEGKPSREHVPPKQFFPSVLRQKLNPNLRTLPSHLACNKEFEKDEDYFFASCGVLSEFEPVSGPIMDDLYKKLVLNPKNNMLYKIMEEFREPEGNLILPGNKVIKEIDFSRIKRIVWKITRGLHFIEFNTILPEETSKEIFMFQAGDIIPNHFHPALECTEIKGDFPVIFSYRHNVFDRVKDRISAQIWNLAFWNSLIFYVRTLGFSLEISSENRNFQEIGR